ncbi:MAG: branched-chain amino acid ABC transporter permease [Pseudomonadota bacterium]
MVSVYWQGFLSGLTNGSIYALIGLGFTLIYRSTNVLNIAQGEFAMVGGLLAASLAGVLGLPLPAAFILAVLITGLVGSLFERAFIRPVLNQPFFIQLMITVVAIWVFHGFAMVVWGKQPHTLPHLFGRTPIAVFGAIVLPQVVCILVVTALVIIAFRLFLGRTMFGRALRVCAEDKSMARLLGINVERFVNFSFFLSAALGALGGILVTPLITMSFYTGTNLMIKAVTATIIGGLFGYFGPVVGGLLLGIMESWAGIAIHGLLKDAIALTILILVLLFRPLP